MLYIFIVLVLLAVLALKLSHLAKAPATVSGVVSRPILSENELEFFHRLQRALPAYHVFPQVAANALLKVAAAVPKQRTHAARNKFAQKHVDFIVCERDSLEVKAIIELDDKTHLADRDRARDLMFQQAGYAVHRFESRRKPTEQQIASLFELPKAAELPALDSHGF